MLGAGGFPWARAFRAGTVRWERKWEHSNFQKELNSVLFVPLLDQGGLPLTP
jgi:hypothetical protein